MYAVGGLEPSAHDAAFALEQRYATLAGPDELAPGALTGQGVDDPGHWGRARIKSDFCGRPSIEATLGYDERAAAGIGGVARHVEAAVHLGRGIE